MLGVRACQCGFCRRHGAMNTSDSEGAATIDADPQDILRYRFGLRTADFLVCGRCGIYIAAVIGEAANARCTLNVAGLDIEEFRGLEEASVDYSAETREDRIARRFRKWTPTEFVNAEFNNWCFGPQEQASG